MLCKGNVEVRDSAVVVVGQIDAAGLFRYTECSCFPLNVDVTPVFPLCYISPSWSRAQAFMSHRINWSNACRGHYTVLCCLRACLRAAECVYYITQYLSRAQARAFYFCLVA